MRRGFRARYCRARARLPLEFVLAALGAAPALAGETAECANDSCNAERGRDRAPLQTAPLSLGATLVEFSMAPLPGVRERPHHGLAFDSQAVRDLLNDAGLDAERCQAPIVRMHSKLSSAVGFNGTAWVYARCALR